MQKSAREHFSKAKNKHFELMSEIKKKKKQTWNINKLAQKYIKHGLRKILLSKFTRTRRSVIFRSRKCKIRNKKPRRIKNVLQLHEKVTVSWKVIVLETIRFELESKCERKLHGKLAHAKIFRRIQKIYPSMG